MTSSDADKRLHGRSDGRHTEAGVAGLPLNSLKVVHLRLTETTAAIETWRQKIGQVDERVRRFKAGLPRLPKLNLKLAVPAPGSLMDSYLEPPGLSRARSAGGELFTVVQELRAFLTDRSQRQKTQPDAHQESTASSGQGAMGKKELALATLVLHPDWTVKQIAVHIGVNRTTLYDWSEFQLARQILKAGRDQLPRGSKDAEGGLEACDTA